MAENAHARELGAHRAGLDDFRGQRKIEASLPPIAPLRQAAALRLRRQRAVERLHGLGPRVTFELLDELARHHPDIADDIDRRLAAYAERLTPALLRPIGGDRFPAPPMRIVGGAP